MLMYALLEYHGYTELVNVISSDKVYLFLYRYLFAYENKNKITTIIKRVRDR